MKKCKIKPFGIPAYINCKRRVAKKWVEEGYKKSERFLWKRYILFHNYKGIVTDCTGLNMLPTEIEPIYINIGRKSKVLIDINITGKTNSCSMMHCCINKPKSYEECQEYIRNILETYKDNDPWGFFERYSKIKLNPDGTFQYA